MTTHKIHKTSRVYDWRPALLAWTALCACDDGELAQGEEDEDAAVEPADPADPDESEEPEEHHDGHADDLDFTGMDVPISESISCETFTDTGYVDGTPYQITLVTVDGKPVQVDAANAFYVMREAAAAQGVNIAVVSGFRTMAQQEYFYHCFKTCSCNSCNEAAKPGFSNHQSGHAFDLNWKAPGVYNWLNAHGKAYGFYRTVPSEEWHWEWWGDGPGGGPCAVQPPPPPPPEEPPLRRVSQSINRDYNGDGADDVFWYQPGEGADPLWLGAESGEFTKTFAPNVNSLYFTVAGDFNGDGRGDVFFYAPGELPEAVWNGTAGGSFNKSTPKNAQGAVWNVGGSYTPIAGNFNGDAYDDVLWYAPGEAEDFIWYGLGGNKFQNANVNIAGEYLPVAGDFDGDGRSDILWYGGGPADEAVWYGRASKTNPFDKLTTSNVAGLYLPFSGDFNKDGRDDIFWYAPGAAPDNLWNGTANRGFSHTQALRTDGTAWNVMGSFEAVPGDFDGDGASDILWYGVGGDLDSIWFATSGNRFKSQLITVSGKYAPI